MTPSQVFLVDLGPVQSLGQRRVRGGVASSRAAQIGETGVGFGR